MPAEQLVHDEAPANEYVPASHAVQLAMEAAPAVDDFVPATQLVHAAAPDELQEPATHDMQLDKVA